jgi:NAD(P) transhydrogenase subunit alpha
MAAAPQNGTGTSSTGTTLGVPRETFVGETRVAMAPEVIKKLVKSGVAVLVEAGAGEAAGFPDAEFVGAGAKITGAAEAWSADIVAVVRKPAKDQVRGLKQGGILIGWLEPYKQDGTLEALASHRTSAFSMELIPRTSRAQSMDALSSQANIAGYRAVLEAAARYPRFFPMMMTSAGSAKPVRVAVLGAGVAGLQAIATARRLGAHVEAFDVRPEVREQIESLGAKFMDLELKEEGTGAGGYAKALSEEGQRRQQAALTERLKKVDVVITTANIPGRKSPVLVTEEAVRGMRAGSVIVDLAAENGGNCPLTEAGRIVVKHGVTLVGITNYPALVPADSSFFYSKNIANLLGLMLQPGKDGAPTTIKIDLADDIVEGSLATHAGEVRVGKPKPAPAASIQAAAPAPQGA